jgi:hypothetical protein
VASSSSSEVVIENSRIQFSTGAAVYSAGALSSVQLADSIVTLNQTGLSHASNGRLVSLGRNSVANNSVDGTFTHIIGTQ